MRLLVVHLKTVENFICVTIENCAELQSPVHVLSPVWCFNHSNGEINNPRRAFSTKVFIHENKIEVLNIPPRWVTTILKTVRKF